MDHQHSYFHVVTGRICHNEYGYNNLSSSKPILSLETDYHDNSLFKKNPTRSRHLNINKKWPKFQSLWNWVELIASKLPWFITSDKHPLVFPSNITIRFEVRITITCTTRAVSGKSAGRYKSQRRHRIKALFKKTLYFSLLESIMF